VSLIFLSERACEGLTSDREREFLRLGFFGDNEI